MAKVTAYVYDITQGMAAQMSLPLIGKKIDIVPHTGIAVFGKEYFFGGGPQTGIPGQSVPVPVAQVLELGQTSKTCEELETYIRNVLSLEHTEQKYDLLKHNCNHYADDVAKFLLDGRGLPSSIVNVAEEALSTPQGQSLKVMIENMERSMRSGGTSMNPFGSAAPPAVPAPLAAPDESSGELKVALAELAKNETEVRRTALQMLLKMTKNVEDNPSETKFRRIKMANPAFQKKVEAANGGVDVVMAAGWLPDTNEEGEDCWLLNDSSAMKQVSVRKILDDELKKLPTPVAPTPAPAAAPVASSGYGGPAGGLPGGFPNLPGGLPAGMANNPMMQQMMNNPAMMQQAQQMMQDPNMMAQVQQMMQNPQAMSQLQQMMGNGGLGGFGR